MQKQLIQMMDSQHFNRRWWARCCALVLVAACSKGPPHHSEPPARAEPGTSGRGLVVGQAGSSASPAAVPAQPISRTAGVLDAATLARLSAITLPRFDATPHANAGPGVLDVDHQTHDHPTIAARIAIAPCTSKGPLPSCLPMALAGWEGEPRYTELKNRVPADLRARPQTIFEIGTTELANQKMIYTYQLGQAGAGSGRPPYTDAYTLYFNDGMNQIRVVAEYADTPRDSQDQLVEAAPKQDLETVARQFMDAYVHAW